MTVQSSTSEIHSVETVHPGSFLTCEIWGIRQGQFGYFITCNSSFSYKRRCAGVKVIYVCVYAIVNTEQLLVSLFFSCDLSDNIVNLRAASWFFLIWNFHVKFWCL